MADPTQDSIDILVREFVSLASGIASKYVIPGNDSHPGPNIPYASVLELTKKGNGIDSEVARPQADLTKKLLVHRGSRIITYSVQFYRTGAADAAEGLLSYASTTPGQIWLGENGLSWNIAGDIINVDAIMGSKNEQRRAVNISFRYQSNRQQIINSLGSVEIDFELSAESDLTETLEVTDA